MDLQLAGKGVVVTGGSKGTGLAVVKALLAEGARVVAASRRISTELKETEAVHTPAEVARLITFAVSPNNINGAEYIIDGGITKNV
ncbi:SDR family NAD(P)-dependent oxidoreductase [Nocardia abscessus]|uniref:SDR family NAD(P)-dependent oxidoreductase n=1 Tax=Nocardia TaxID=1817 RepID=UPI0018957398|nr:SDR family NAD(P)-dependent oxidoreductase [Nocardia abscessus]